MPLKFISSWSHSKIQNMRISEFIKEIKSPQRKACYLLNGGDKKSVETCLKAVFELVPEDFHDFNLARFSFDEGGAGRIINEAQTMPLMRPPRIVVVKNVVPNADDSNKLAEYVKNPNEQSCLIIISDKADLRLKFFKALKDKGGEVSCQPPKGAELIAWLRDEFADRGHKVGQDILRLLIERCGEEATLLANEMEKLCLYVKADEKITLELAKSLISLSPHGNIFALGEALGARDAQGATAVLLELLATEHHLQIMAMMVRHFRLMLQIKARQAVVGNRLGPEEAKGLGMHPFVLQKTQGQCQNWTWQGLQAALNKLEQASKTFVTSPTPANLVLENLALQLINCR